MTATETQRKLSAMVVDRNHIITFTEHLHSLDNNSSDSLNEFKVYERSQTQNLSNTQKETIQVKWSHNFQVKTG